MFNLSLNFFTSVVGGIVINVLEFMIFLELYNDLFQVNSLLLLSFCFSFPCGCFAIPLFLWSCITWYIF